MIKHQEEVPDGINSLAVEQAALERGSSPSLEVF